MGLGDDLMWLGEASKVHEQHPDAVIHDGQGFSPMWENVPWVVQPNAQTDKEKIFVSPKPNGQRWYIDHFGGGRVYYKKYEPIPAPYVVSDDESAVADAVLKANGITGQFVVINPDTKNTTLSSNKDWGFGNWQELTNLLKDDVAVVRLKPTSSTTDVSGRVEYKEPEIEGAINIPTSSARAAFAVASKASLIITPEGGLHHFAAAVGVPAMVIYGSVISPESTGYKDCKQRYYYFNDDHAPCGRQSHCSRCRDAMNAIEPALLQADAIKILNQSQSKD